MKFLLVILMASSVYSSTENSLELNMATKKVKDFVSNFSFNYYINYTGPSLSGSHQEGATFNRFSGGVDYNGNDSDSTGSTEIFQSFKLSYKFKNNMSISYGVTMQEGLTERVEYQTPNGTTGVRQDSKSRTYNGHRMSLFIPSVANFSFGWISTSIFYQTPVASERKNQNIYVAGIQPGISFFSSIPGLRYGINSNIERLVFKNERSQNKQGLRVNLMPQVAYQINERFTLKKSLDFDWDQKGEQLGTTNFGRNMQDVGRLGLGTKLMNKTFIDVYVTYSLSQLDIKNTALGASLDISI